MVAPGVLVIGTPLLVGFILGTDGVSGILAGCIVSGVQIAFSFSNTGGAWDNAKKYVEAQKHHSKVLAKEGVEHIFKKNTEAHAAAVCGDTVGDNVGDIAGMGSDLFGSLAESTCASLVVASTSTNIINTQDAMYFPLMITAMGIIVSFVTQFHATIIAKVTMDNVEGTVKWQLIISTILMTVAIYPLTFFLPDYFDVYFGAIPDSVQTNITAALNSTTAD